MNKNQNLLLTLYLVKKINLIEHNNYIFAYINGKLIYIIDSTFNNIKLNLFKIINYDRSQIIDIPYIYLLKWKIHQLKLATAIIINESTVKNMYILNYNINLNFNLIQNSLNILENKNKLIVERYNIFTKIIHWKEIENSFNKQKNIYNIYIVNQTTTMRSQQIKLFIQNEENNIYNQPYSFNTIISQKYYIFYKIYKTYCNEVVKNKVLQYINNNINLYYHPNRISIYIKRPNVLLKKRDHRNIARQLDLYHIQDNAPGMIFWHKNGWIIFQELKNFVRKKLQQYQYQEVRSPTMIDYALWEKTGHWDNYCEYIFTTTSEHRRYCIKPMSCPGHIQIFNHGIKTYKDLPMRMAEFGHCHRNEPSGSLHGLMRIREFTQDDAHIFCSISQVYQELNHCIKMIYDIYNTFGFKKIIVKISTRPKKRIGEDAVWDITEQYLYDVLNTNNIPFKYQPYNGAFYGPKIEFVLLDSLNRTWQCGTIQLDFSLPNLLGASYVDKNNKHKVPILIHRAILGSIERFIGLLIEEYLGFLPTWLAPIQIVLMNVTSEQSEYVIGLAKKFEFENFRIKIDLRNEKISFKIRSHIIHRIPYMLICGNTEMNNGTVSVRTLKGKKFDNYTIDILLKKLKYEIYNYSFHQMGE